MRNRVFSLISLLLCISFCSASNASSTVPCHYIKKTLDDHSTHYVKVCPKDKTFEQKVNSLFESITDEQASVLHKRLQEQLASDDNKASITFFEPTYVLPFYHTNSPDYLVYSRPGTTPLNQRIMKEEFKMQISLQFPLIEKLFKTPIDLNVAYTHLAYWQVYAKSQYFRETNYQPALFLSDNFSKNWLGYLGIVHQSNGRGGKLERSWNRVFFNLMLSGDHWLINVNPWVLVFKSTSSDLHNPDIAHYLGYGRVIFAFNFWNQTLSLMLRNTFASGFKRGAVELNYSFPIHGKLLGFAQVFSGYGQSLIEYNHYTNSIGIGVALNDWI